MRTLNSQQVQTLALRFRAKNAKKKQNKITNKHANLFWAIKTDLTQKSCHFRVFSKYTLFLQFLILRTLMTFCVNMYKYIFYVKI